MGRATHAEEVAKLLKNPDKDMRRSAAQGLGKMGDRGAEVAMLLKDATFARQA